jgi:hypothetical protein
MISPLAPWLYLPPLSLPYKSTPLLSFIHLFHSPGRSLNRDIPVHFLPSNEFDSHRPKGHTIEKLHRPFKLSAPKDTQRTAKGTAEDAHKYLLSNEFGVIFTVTDNKCLLGVIIPAPQGRNYLVSQPPLSQTRRAELDASALIDYSGSTDDELRALIRERGIGLRGWRKTAHYIKALQAPELRDREVCQAWKDNVTVELQSQQEQKVQQEVETQALDKVRLQQHERIQELAKRQDLMFASKYAADPTRKSFLDLPLNIRNTVYERALSDGIQGPVMKLCYLFDKSRFLPFSREYKCGCEHEET